MAPDSPADDLVALREALLVDDLDPPDGALVRAGEWVGDRLGRLRLTWLALPLLLALAIPDIVGTMRGSRKFLANDVRSTGLYSQLSGKDLDVSRAELWRIRVQLGLIKHGLPQHQEAPGRSPPRASRAELEAAADALLRYFLGGRQTKDALLAETQAAYAAYEQLMERSVESGAERRRSRRRVRKEEQRSAGASERYIEAWRRWFEQEAATRPSH
jgi:hypothetical protein